jgi:hypothetical protein
VLSGKTSLHRAVLDDRLRVVGAVTDVDRALDVLVSYVLGAIHLPSEHRRHARFLTPTPPIGTGGAPNPQEPR